MYVFADHIRRMGALSMVTKFLTERAPRTAAAEVAEKTKSFTTGGLEDTEKLRRLVAASCFVRLELLGDFFFITNNDDLHLVSH
jgi:hypothetical protein